MGSKFRGVKQVKEKVPTNKQISGEELQGEEGVPEVSSGAGIAAQQVVLTTWAQEQADKLLGLEDQKLTHSTYAFLKLDGAKDYRLIKIDYNPVTHNARVVGSQQTDHQGPGIVFQEGQKGLKHMYERKAQGGGFNGGNK